MKEPKTVEWSQRKELFWLLGKVRTHEKRVNSCSRIRQTHYIAPGQKRKRKKGDDSVNTYFS